MEEKINLHLIMLLCVQAAVKSPGEGVGLGGSCCSAVKVIYTASQLVFSVKEADLGRKKKKNVVKHCKTGLSASFR